MIHSPQLPPSHCIWAGWPHRKDKKGNDRCRLLGAGPSSTSVLAPMPCQVAAEDSDRGGGRGRGRDDLGDDWGKYRKLAEATEVMQALEREERGGEEWRGEKPCPGT